MKEYIIYATEKGEPKYRERVMFETKDKELAEKYKKFMIDQGFDHVRIWIYEGGKPDFIDAINI